MEKRWRSLKFSDLYYTDDDYQKFHFTESILIITLNMHANYLIPDTKKDFPTSPKLT